MAVPAEVTTALQTMSADALTVGAAVLVALVAVIAFKFMRKAIDGGGSSYDSGGFDSDSVTYTAAERRDGRS